MFIPNSNVQKSKTLQSSLCVKFSIPNSNLLNLFYLTFGSIRFYHLIMCVRNQVLFIRLRDFRQSSMDLWLENLWNLTWLFVLLSNAEKAFVLNNSLTKILPKKCLPNTPKNSRYRKSAIIFSLPRASSCSKLLCPITCGKVRVGSD